MHSDVLNLEAVYYSAPIPSSKASLTALALVFDRIYFPNVYLPLDGYDPGEVRKEADRIEALRFNDLDTAITVGTLRALPNLPHLQTFCSFTGHKGQMFGGDLTRAKELRDRLNEALFGPYPQGVEPTFMTGSHKGLPGGGYIDHPDPLNYMANAVLYSAEKGLPLVNDSNLPVVPMDGGSVTPQLLASVLALKCVEFALPKVPALTPASIVEAREELKPQLRAFRSSIARLAATLAGMLETDATAEEIQRKAEILVRTEVAAALSDLEAAVNKPRVLTLENAFGVGVLVSPVLAAASTSLPLAIVMALGGLGVLGLKIQNAQNESQRSGLYYLLKARRLNGK